MAQGISLTKKLALEDMQEAYHDVDDEDKLNSVGCEYEIILNGEITKYKGLEIVHATELYHPNVEIRVNYIINKLSDVCDNHEM